MGPPSKTSSLNMQMCLIYGPDTWRVVSSPHSINNYSEIRVLFSPQSRVWSLLLVKSLACSNDIITWSSQKSQDLIVSPTKEKTKNLYFTSPSIWFEALTAKRLSTLSFFQGLLALKVSLNAAIFYCQKENLWGKGRPALRGQLTQTDTALQLCRILLRLRFSILLLHFNIFDTISSLGLPPYGWPR